MRAKKQARMTAALERTLERAAEIAEALNVVVQLVVGALLVGAIDLYFITSAQQGWTINVPAHPALGGALMVAIPVAVTLVWITFATVVLVSALRTTRQPT